MNLKAFGVMLIAVMGVSVSHTVLAGVAEYSDVKMPCAVLKNGKVLKQQTCVADGFEHAGAGYGGGYGWDFSIKGYGKITLDSGVSFKTDANGELVRDEHDEIIEDESWTTLNKKPADIRLRMPKTFAVLSEQQENQYYEGKLKEPYTCWYYTGKTSGKFDEVCYLQSN